MVKYLLNSLFILSMLSSLSFASNYSDAKLQAEYGHNLTDVPFFLRFTFSKEFDKDWEKSDYVERKAFLKEYDAGVTAENKKARAEAKAAAAQAKDALLEERMEQRQERAKLKANADEIRAEAAAEKLRQKVFDTGIHDQEKELELLQRDSVRGGGLMTTSGPTASSGAPQQGTDQGSQGSY